MVGHVARERSICKEQGQHRSAIHVYQLGSLKCHSRIRSRVERALSWMHAIGSWIELGVHLTTVLRFGYVSLYGFYGIYPIEIKLLITVRSCKRT
jgi:hypothetical protein